MEKESIYMSLDEARVELKRRWANEGLKGKIREALGEKFIPHYDRGPLFVTTRQLLSADNSTTFFAQCARYVGAKAFAQEFLGDRFVHFNEEKKGLGRLRIKLNDGSKATVDIMNFQQNQRTALCDCVLKDGSNLVNFHHNLLSIDDNDIQLYDNTSWYQNIGRASDYYHDFLLHFVAHSILFETFYDEGQTTEDTFTHEVVYPNIESIRKEFNISPIIVRSFPETQTDEEDFYWWSHSPQVNEFINSYAIEHNFEIKQI